MVHRSSLVSTSTPALAAVLASALACAGADDTTRVVPDGAPAPGAPAEPGAATDDGVLMVMDRVCTPDACSHYMYFMRELPGDGVLDRSRGIELGDTQGAVYQGFAYVFDRQNGVVTRWSVDDDLVARREQSVSFQGTGLTQIDATANVFVSPTRAFLLDSSAGLLVTWNPSAMEIVATTTLPDTVLFRDNIPLYAIWPTEARGRVYYSASWYDVESRRGHESAALLSFPSDVDRPRVEVLEDARCGITASVAPFADERGDVYFAGDWFSGLNQIGVVAGQAASPACLLRVGAAGAVEPEFYVDLLRAADARAVTSAFYLGEGRWLLNVWPSSVPPPTPAELAEDPDAYLGARNFEYVVIVDLQSGTRRPVSGLSRGSYGGLTPMYLDGVPLIQLFPTQGGEQTGALLYAVAPDGAARRLLQAGPNGDFELVARLR